MPAPDPKNQPLLVTVVSKNASTLAGLDTYSAGRGRRHHDAPAPSIASSR